MKRTRLKRRGGLGRTAEQLVRLASGLAESGSRVEDRYWEQQLSTLIDETLTDNDEEVLNTALDHLYSADPRAYDELADNIESRAECAAGSIAGHDVVLIAAPVLAWSRYRIPATNIPAAVLANLRVHLQAHVLAKGAKLSVADFLFSPDQLPRSFVETWQLMRELGSAALANETLKIDLSTLAETNQFLSDTRYLIGAIAVPRGLPLFRWNEAKTVTRESALKEWVKQGGPCLEPLLTGCAFETLLADAYHAACRTADMASRPYSLRASVAFLQTTLGKPAESLRAVIGGFYDKRLEEYRIGFGPRDSEAIYHGVVWPLLGAEDETTDVVGEIETLLREAGIKEIVVHSQQFPFEFCDDCGAPLYPNLEGETVHAELPEQTSAQSQSLH